MRGFVIRFVVTAAALFFTSYIVEGMHVTFPALLVAALILGIFNAVVRPVLILLTLPLNILTLGLFTFVINAILLILTDKVVRGFDIEGFFSAFVGAIVMAIISAILNWLVKDAREKDRA